MSRITTVFLVAIPGVIGALPPVAVAQPRTMWHQLSFEEVNPATGAPVTHPNGILEPGEGAKISLSLAFDPPVNTILVEPPLVAGFRVHAAAESVFHVESQGETTGNWTGLAVGPGWDAWNGDPPQGLPTPSGRGVNFIHPFQHAVGADTRNPAPDVWSGIWVPHDYSSRQVRFSTWPAGIGGFQIASKVWHERPGFPGEYHALNAWTETGEVYIPIVPSPTAALALALSSAVTLRRRRLPASAPTAHACCREKCEMNVSRRNSHAHQALIIGILAAAPFPAIAQPRTMWHHLSFEEVNPATGAPVPHPNGILEPGEGARISLSLAFDPPVNTVFIEPSILAGYRVLAAATSYFHLESFGKSTGSWSALALQPGWDVWNGDPPQGFPTANGRNVSYIRPMQHAEGADTRNPVPNVWSGIWVPDSYTSRQVLFSTWPAGISGFQTASMLWLERIAPPGEFVNVHAWTEIGEVSIPIIPAPAAALPFALSTALALRRRR